MSCQTNFEIAPSWKGAGIGSTEPSNLLIKKEKRIFNKNLFKFYIKIKCLYYIKDSNCSRSSDGLAKLKKKPGFVLGKVKRKTEKNARQKKISIKTNLNLKLIINFISLVENKIYILLMELKIYLSIKLKKLKYHSFLVIKHKILKFPLATVGMIGSVIVCVIGITFIFEFFSGTSGLEFKKKFLNYFNNVSFAQVLPRFEKQKHGYLPLTTIPKCVSLPNLNSQQSTLFENGNFKQTLKKSLSMGDRSSLRSHPILTPHEIGNFRQITSHPLSLNSSLVFTRPVRQIPTWKTSTKDVNRCNMHLSSFILKRSHSIMVLTRPKPDVSWLTNLNPPIDSALFELLPMPVSLFPTEKKPPHRSQSSICLICSDQKELNKPTIVPSVQRKLNFINKYFQYQAKHQGCITSLRAQEDSFLPQANPKQTKNFINKVFKLFNIKPSFFSNQNSLKNANILFEISTHKQDYINSNLVGIRPIQISNEKWNNTLKNYYGVNFSLNKDFYWQNFVKKNLQIIPDFDL
jgi:hypothetical protein